MRKLSTVTLCSAMVFAASAMATNATLMAQVAVEQSADDKKPPFGHIKFKGRVKFHQEFTRVFKISVDPEALPLDSDTMTAIMNGPTVAGVAARDVFGLSTEEYEPFVKLTVKTSEKLGAVIAKVDFKLKADGRIPTSAVNALAEAVRKHMQVILAESIEIDRKSLQKRQDVLLERQAFLEKQYVEIWQNRIQIAEDAGLAESSVGNKRANISDMETSLRDVQLELELRRSRLESVQEEIKEAEASSESLKEDPLAQELEKLVRNRANQLDASSDLDDDQRRAAEASMLEAKLRWIARIEELESLKPQSRAKVLVDEIKELATREAFYDKAMTAERDRVRSLYRYDEHVQLMKKKEVRLDDAINRVESKVDDLVNHSEKLGTITVTIVGQ